MKILNIITFAFLITFATHSVSYTPPEQTEEKFQAWVAEFKKEALKQGISQRTLDKAFKDVHLNLRVLGLDRRQPEFSQTFWQYFNRAITKWRVEKGQELYKKHQEQLNEITKKYGVPGRFIIAFWGLETNYGGYTGNTKIIESLATLAYDPRRSKFFTSELLAALKIIDLGHVPIEQMRGSWAGAMGLPQFMPSNYLKYAVDGDNNGKIDLWNSLPDVFHSMGSFLKTIGWQEEENWGREVSLPDGFNLALADGRTEKPLTEWENLGIKLADGRSLPSANLQARLLLPSDYRGPAFLVFENFQVIKRWNRSNNYALAVGHLADRIINRPALSKKAPKNDAALSKIELKEIQERLNLLGFNAGTADGISGPITRKAIRAYQVKHKLPADAFPSKSLLKSLRNAKR